MVVYHVLSIASTGGESTFRSIRFVSGSFIFVAGYLAARFAYQRFLEAGDVVARQMGLRGLKIVMLFTALNLAIAISGVGNPSKPQAGLSGWIENAPTIYLLGDGRLSSFAILLPIAYLLLAAPAAMLAFAKVPRVAPAIMLLLALTAISLPVMDGRWLNLEFVLIGLCGLALGASPSVSRCADARALSPLLTLLCLPVALFLTGRHAPSGALYVVGVAVILKLLYDLIRFIDADSLVSRALILLGQYSLFAYIVQIVVIHFLFRAAGAQRWPVGWETAVLMAASGGVTLMLTIAARTARAHWQAIDRAYRWVFD
jgi:hypothetical protein